MLQKYVSKTMQFMTSRQGGIFTNIAANTLHNTSALTAAFSTTLKRSMAYYANPDATMQYTPSSSGNTTPVIDFSMKDGAPPPFFAVDIPEVEEKESYTAKTHKEAPSIILYTRNHLELAHLVNYSTLSVEARVQAILDNLQEHTPLITPRDKIEATNAHRHC